MSSIKTNTNLHLSFQYAFVNLKVSGVQSSTDYFPFGSPLPNRGFDGGSYRFGFNGKEKDDEVYGEANAYDFGARIYDPRVGAWLCIDPEYFKYVDLSPFSYCYNNPMSNNEVNGEYWVGVNDKKVRTIKLFGRILILSTNTSEDLKEYVQMINRSGSKTAVNYFQKVSKNETKVHFYFDNERTGVDEDNPLFGCHQVHDATGKILKWNGEQNRFEGDPAYIIDKEGNIAYKESTITVFLKTMTPLNVKYDVEEKGLSGKDVTLKDAIVATGAHESFHDIDKKTIEAIKANQEGGKSTFDVETPAYELGKEVYKEIKKRK